jgi:hypothetical protein
VATNGTESWALNKGVAKQLVTIEIKNLRKMFGGITVHEYWRK